LARGLLVFVLVAIGFSAPPLSFLVLCQLQRIRDRAKAGPRKDRSCNELFGWLFSLLAGSIRPRLSIALLLVDVLTRLPLMMLVVTRAFMLSSCLCLFLVVLARFLILRIALPPWLMGRRTLVVHVESFLLDGATNPAASSTLDAQFGVAMTELRSMMARYPRQGRCPQLVGYDAEPKPPSAVGNPHGVQRLSDAIRPSRP